MPQRQKDVKIRDVLRNWHLEVDNFSISPAADMNLSQLRKKNL